MKLKYTIIKLKYKSILNYIYVLINDGVKIIKKIDNRFYYINSIGISI